MTPWDASAVITVILDAIQDFLGGIGSAIVDFFTSLTTDPTTGALTPLAVWLLVFLGLAIAIGLGRLVFAIFRTRQ